MRALTARKRLAVASLNGFSTVVLFVMLVQALEVFAQERTLVASIPQLFPVVGPHVLEHLLNTVSEDLTVLDSAIKLG